jgi:hypothetical protein
MCRRADVSKDSNTFIVKGEAEVDCLKLEDGGKAVHRNVENARPATRRRIPEQLTPQQYRCLRISNLAVSTKLED